MRSFKIGNWTVVPTLNVLRCGDQVAKLEPRAMDALVYLTQARPRVVSSDELLRNVWQGRVFDDGVVYRKVNQLRRALGDDPQHPRFIETIPKRGYRLIANVEELETVDGAHSSVDDDNAAASGADAAPKRYWPRVLLLGLAAAASVAGAFIALRPLALPEHSAADLAIAVLPCENLSPDADRAYFASGIQEAIIDQLAVLGFRVVGRAAVAPYGAGTQDLGTIARSLNVDAVIECSVRYDNDRVRIAVALSDGESGDTLWRRPYEGVFANYFAIESQIAASVTDALGATVTPSRRAALDNVPPRSARAIELYFSARRYEELGVTNWATAAAQYERAVAEDPGFARAFAQLSLLRASIYAGVEPLREHLEKARVAAEEAVRLDPDLPQSRVAMLTYAFRSRGKAAAEIAEALATFEMDAQGVSEYFALRAAVSQSLGQWAQAVADATRAVELGAPRDVPLLILNALAHQQVRQYRAAAELFDRIADIAPDDWGTRCHRATLYMVSAGDTGPLRAMQDDVPLCGGVIQAAILDRDYDLAVQLAESSPFPPGDPRKQALVGRLLSFSGRTEEARPLIESARGAFTAQLASAPIGVQSELRLGLADLCVHAGDLMRAREYIDEALARIGDVPPGGVPNLRLSSAAVLARTGDVDRALEQLDRFLAGAGVWSIEGIARSPDFASLLADARFAALREKYRPDIATL